jgi:squalene-hopene/tetraprenyl-beta-curcumene cyclase
MLSRRSASLRAKEYIFRQSADGMWRDFLTRAGESDEWATAFVSLYLLRGGTRQDELRTTAHQLILRQRPCGGWGYNPAVPADADSTACCTRAIRAILPDAPHEVAAACVYLEQHRRPTGYCTYRDSMLLRDYLAVDASLSVSGWCERAHACVTASTALALGGAADHGTGALRASQQTDGSWETYWWCTPMYPTVVAIDAFFQLGDARDRTRIDAALDWIVRSQRRDGSWDNGDGEGGAFVTGLALHALAFRPRDRDAWSRGIHWLRQCQRPDGAWDPCPILQIPPPWTCDPASVRGWKRGGLGAPARIADQRRLFTTAVCYAAFNPSPGGHHGRTR